MRSTRVLISTLALLVLAAPAAMASTPCQDGAAASVDGTVRNFVKSQKGTFLFIDAPAWDCGPIRMIVKDAGTCTLGSAIQAKGTFSKQDGPNLYSGWTLNESLGNSSFSCNRSPAHR